MQCHTNGGEDVAERERDEQRDGAVHEHPLGDLLEHVRLYYLSACGEPHDDKDDGREHAHARREKVTELFLFHIVFVLWGPGGHRLSQLIRAEVYQLFRCVPIIVRPSYRVGEVANNSDWCSHSTRAVADVHIPVSVGVLAC